MKKKLNLMKLSDQELKKVQGGVAEGAIKVIMSGGKPGGLDGLMPQPEERDLLR